MSDGHQRAILLDRDGTLIVERDYLSDPALVELESGVATALPRLRKAGFALVVVSNQSGVGRGYMTEADVAAVNARVGALLAQAGVAIDGWYHCPHHPDVACDCRKPQAGLALRARDELGLDLPRSYVIGDKPSDLELARAVDARGVLVASGYGSQAKDWALREGFSVAQDMAQAADLILAQADDSE